MSAIGKILNKGVEALGHLPSAAAPSAGSSLKSAASEGLSGLGGKGLSAMAPRAGSLPGIVKSLAGGVSGLVGGAMNLATNVLAEGIKHTPGGMLLRHTSLGREATGLVNKALDSKVGQVATSVVGMMGPEGAAVEVGVDVFKKAFGDEPPSA
jgi:hypothetical protein